MEGTDLTPEQEAKFLEEAADLSGTIDKKDLPEGQGGTDNPETPPKTDGGEDEGGETGEEGKKETKIEKKVKKLLSKKNQAENETEELKETVKELKIESEKNKFYADFPEAKEHFEKIDSLIEEKPSLSREDAFMVLQGRGEISISRGGNSFVGRTSSKNTTPKDITKGSTADMEKHLKDNFSEIGGNLV